jgi:hypothetical protein
MNKFQLPMALATGTIMKYRLALAKSNNNLAKANTSAYFSHLAILRLQLSNQPGAIDDCNNHFYNK